MSLSLSIRAAVALASLYSLSSSEIVHEIPSNLSVALMWLYFIFLRCFKEVIDMVMVLEGLMPNGFVQEFAVWSVLDFALVGGFVLLDLLFDVCFTPINFFSPNEMPYQEENKAPYQEENENRYEMPYQEGKEMPSKVFVALTSLLVFFIWCRLCSPSPPPPSPSPRLTALLQQQRRQIIPQCLIAYQNNLIKDLQTENQDLKDILNEKKKTDWFTKMKVVFTTIWWCVAVHICAATMAGDIKWTMKSMGDDQNSITCAGLLTRHGEHMAVCFEKSV